jgi:hypothetical protein
MTTRIDSFSRAKELSRMDDPAVRKRCIQLKWRSDLQRYVYVAAFVSLFITYILLERGYFGYKPRYGHIAHPPMPAFIPWGFASLAIAIVLLLGASLARNYCLIDPVEHRLYHFFRFLWWSRRELVFRAEDILAITTDGQPRQGRYGVHWYYRMVAVGNDGRKEPLSHWRRNGLDQWNAKGRELAPQLGCANHEAPSERRVSVENEGGVPTLKFDTPTKPPLTVKRLILILVAVALWFYFSFYRRWQ